MPLEIQQGLISCDSEHCTFSDEFGIKYLVYGNSIIRKDYNFIPDRLDAWAPFGLESDDRLTDVMHKLELMSNASPFYVGLSPAYDEGLVVSTGLCLKTLEGEVFEFGVVFDEQERMKILYARILPDY